MAGGVEPDELRAYADVVLRCGVNIEEGEKLLIFGRLEHSELVHALADRAYAHGAAVAQAFYIDDDIQRSQAAGAPTDEMAAYVSPWFERLIDTMIDERWAWISIAGESRETRSRAPPRSGWAPFTEPSEPSFSAPSPLSSTGASARAPIGDGLSASTASRTRRGSGRTCGSCCAWTSRTPSKPGMGAGTSWRRAPRSSTRARSRPFTSWAVGRSCIANLPTEEVFVSPDWRGVEGMVVMTQPVSVNGVLVEDLVLRFAST